MSSSLLYHTWGVRGIAYLATQYEGQTTRFRAKVHPNFLRCSNCSSTHVQAAGSVQRVLQMLPVGRRHCELHVEIPRLLCLKCGKTRQPHLPFANPKKQYVKAMERYANDLTKHMSIRDVACFLGLGWDTVKGIHKRHLGKMYKRIRLRDLKYIAIDEVCVGRPRKFLTVVMDLESGAVIYVAKGKGGKALKPFWTKLKRARARIRAVATDMGAAYVSAVMTHLPTADLVLDHFHVIKWFNEKLTMLRRALYKQADTMGKKTLKGVRWLLLKNPENLRPHEKTAKDERYRLQEALAFNEPLMMAYYMKEELRHLWKQATQQAAERLLEDWCRRADASGVKLLQAAAKQLRLSKSGLLNWYDHRISTGPLEAMNNKIGTLQRNAYGYRDEEYFHLRIKHLHRCTYALSG
jgi:transposase